MAIYYRFKTGVDIIKVLNIDPKDFIHDIRGQITAKETGIV